MDEAVRTAGERPTSELDGPGPRVWRARPCREADRRRVVEPAIGNGFVRRLRADPMDSRHRRREPFDEGAEVARSNHTPARDHRFENRPHIGVGSDKVRGNKPWSRDAGPFEPDKGSRLSGSIEVRVVFGPLDPRPASKDPPTTPSLTILDHE